MDRAVEIGGTDMDRSMRLRIGHYLEGRVCATWAELLIRRGGRALNLADGLQDERVARLMKRLTRWPEP